MPTDSQEKQAESKTALSKSNLKQTSSVIKALACQVSSVKHASQQFAKARETLVSNAVKTQVEKAKGGLASSIDTIDNVSDDDDKGLTEAQRIILRTKRL